MSYAHEGLLCLGYMHINLRRWNWETIGAIGILEKTLLYFRLIFLVYVFINMNGDDEKVCFT